MLKTSNVISFNGQGKATSVTFTDSPDLYIYIYIYTHINGHLCLTEIDSSQFSQSVPLLLLLGTPEPTK
jgi:hypothetical protein